MKILFYDKHVKFNNPFYAIKLLNELEKDNHQIFVMVSDSHKIRGSSVLIEDLVGVNFREIYSGFNFKFISNLDEVNTILKNFKPDLFLSDFCLTNFEWEVLKLIKSKKIRDIGMDMVSSEILLYARNYRMPLHLIHQIKGYFERINNISDRFIGHKLVSSLGSSSLDNKPISNIITLKGKFFQDIISMKYKISRFPVTGSIQFDQLFENWKSTEIFDKLGIDKKNPIIIMAPSPMVEESIDSQFIVDTCTAVSQNGEFQLFINPHPSDRLFYPDRFNNYPGKQLSSIDFYKLLPHSKALITPSSTVGLEAAFCNVPVLGSDIYKNLNWEFPYFKDGFNVGKRINERNIVQTINQILENKISFDFKPFIEHMCYKQDGQSYKRLSLIVNNYISKIS